MSSHPPASAFRESKARTQAGREARMPATIAIDGTNYQGAARIFAERPELEPGGWKRVQRCTVWVLKTRLRTRPTEEAEIVVNGLGFRVSEIGGDDATELEWVIRGERVPGRDS